MLSWNWCLTCWNCSVGRPDMWLFPQVTKIGNLITPLMIGEQGEAALIAYDGRVRRLQEFTSDSDKITAAVKSITPGSSSNRLIDSVEEATRMLRTRPGNRRRLI